jgi:hypothetical protein
MKRIKARLKEPGLTAQEARSLMGRLGGLAGAGSPGRQAAARKGGLARQRKP